MKSIVFLGRSLKSLREFPPSVKRAIGYELDKVQRGLDPKDWKAMPSIGPGIREIRIRIDGAWRVVYIANRGDVVYVLHAFQRKTQRTAMQDMTTIKSALKELQ